MTEKEQATNMIDVYTDLLRIKQAADKEKEVNNQLRKAKAKLEALGQHRIHFIEAMDDDLNTADALSSVFELVRDVNAYMGANQDATKAFLSGAHALLMELTGVLGLVQQRTEENIDTEIEELIAQRAAAKKNKDFAEADRIREYLLNEKGVVIKDTRQGTQWSRV